MLSTDALGQRLLQQIPETSRPVLSVHRTMRNAMDSAPHRSHDPSIQAAPSTQKPHWAHGKATMTSCGAAKPRPQGDGHLQKPLQARGTPERPTLLSHTQHFASGATPWPSDIQPHLSRNIDRPPLLPSSNLTKPSRSFCQITDLIHPCIDAHWTRPTTWRPLLRHSESELETRPPSVGLTPSALLLAS